MANKKKAEVPELYHKCIAVYDLLLKDHYTDHEGNKFWEGSTVKHLQEHLGIEQSHYTYVMRALKRMDCVMQVKRGGNKNPTVWSLLQPPTMELFEGRMNGQQYRYGPNSGPKGRDEHILQMLADLNKRLNTAERAIKTLEKEVMDHDHNL